ncbi:MAG: LPS export ABC transporter periplasmic protein LptC [Acidobacteriaceae bacterium]|jgi:LPS export ABC transporter protein LptC/lipopolysaccharide transport protein LptA|nr:LPS export ABC transporter periplasmic protein LptC [Acidobacteriaceae bacterium]
MIWQKRLRLVIAVVAVVFAVGVAMTLKKRPVAVSAPPVERTDATASVESKGGETIRFGGDQAKVVVHFDTLLTYPDKTTKMLGVAVTTERSGRTFVIKGKEGHVSDNDAAIDLNGDVQITASDGMVIETDEAHYIKADEIATSPGRTKFSRGRISGTGVGFTYNQKDDVLTLNNDVTVRVDPDAKAGTGAMDVVAGGLEFRRNEHLLRFERRMKATREREILEADDAVAHLSADESHLETMELRGNSRVTAANPAPGALQALTGRDVDLKYGPDGQAIEHALVDGTAVIQLAGEQKQPGRQIAAATIDLGIAPDGATLTTLTARNAVQLTMPAVPNEPARTINADLLETEGNPQKGLNRARFTGNVQFNERNAASTRTVRSGVLDVAIGPGFSSMDDAHFTRTVRFVDAETTASAADARYSPAKGTLDLSGTEPAMPQPHLVSPQMTVDATTVSLVLDGPVIDAHGTVKSVLQSKSDGTSEAKLPSLLKQDQPVNVTANELHYDGKANRATYTGNAQLWQQQTQIKAPKMVLDSNKGDLSADGPVATVTMFQETGDDGKITRTRTTGTADAFTYDDSARRATYTGNAHLNGSAGDMVSPKIELYLMPSGDELDRAEAYENVTLRGNQRTTKGTRLTYVGKEGRYLVTGTPVTIVDECGSETIGRTLTFFRATDNIIVDGKDTRGNEQLRTQTTNKSTCPGS